MRQLLSRLFLRPSLRPSLRLSMLVTLALLAGCQLTVVNEGGGIVTSKSGEIHCGDQCEAKNSNYPRGYIEELTAQANEGYVFAGWEGDCSGTDICSIEISGSTARAVRATFSEVELSSDKDITEFSFLAATNTELTTDITGIIDEANTRISLSLPFGTSPAALTASFATSGESVTVNGISQESSQTPNDFTDPVLYTVTAQDGSEKTYTVTVEIEPSNANFFTDFRFTSAANANLTRDAIGIINPHNHTILAQVPNGIDLSSLVASFEINGQQVLVNNIEQVSGHTANSFIETVSYQVIAADQSVRNYDVIVTESNCSDRRWQGEYTITIPEDIDAIKGYSEIASHLVITNDISQPSTLNSLEGLECLTKVRSLTIRNNPQLENLEGLNNLTSISEDLSIERNAVLGNISALSNLTSVEEVILNNNESLLSLNGLENISELNELNLTSLPHISSLEVVHNLLIHDSLSIVNLASITELGYFSQLANFAGRLSIGSNPGLTNLQGLNDIKSVTYLDIFNNSGLTSFEGLNIERIEGKANFRANNALTNFQGLSQLKNLTHTIIEDNESLVNFEGLDSLELTTSIIKIENNSSLSSLEGLGLANSYGGFELINNPSLTSLNGLNPSATTLGRLYLRRNNFLMSLEGLENFTYIDSIEVTSNMRLMNLNGLNSLLATKFIVINGSTILSDISALSNLTHIERELEIKDSLISNLHAFSAVTSIPKLTLVNNENLQNLHGLHNLSRLDDAHFRLNENFNSIEALSNISSMSGSLFIEISGEGTSLKGLENLTQIGRNLTIRSRDLDNLDELNKLESIGQGITIMGTSLTRVDMPQLCTLTGDFWIQNNANLCSSNVDQLQQQLEACGGIDGRIITSGNKVCE